MLLGGRVAAAQREHHVRPRRARGPHLRAGDHDLVAIHLGAGLHAGQVRALVGLGESLAVDVLAGDDPGQEVRPLLGRAVHDDGRADQALAHAAPDPRQAGRRGTPRSAPRGGRRPWPGRRTPPGHCGQISLASASLRSHSAYAGCAAALASSAPWYPPVVAAIVQSVSSASPSGAFAAIQSLKRARNSAISGPRSRSMSGLPGLGAGAGAGGSGWGWEASNPRIKF